MSFPSPFYPDQIEFEETLHPKKMLPNYIDHLTYTIKQKYENKFYKNNFIIKIYSVDEVKDNIIDRDAPMRNNIFTLLASVLICSPMQDTEIIAEVGQYTPKFVFCYNYPIKITISLQDINSEIFKEDGTNIYKIGENENEGDSEGDSEDEEEFNDDNKLNIGEYVRILIKNIEPFPEWNIFVCDGYLLDMATKKEIKQFKNKDNDYDNINIM